MNAYKAQVQHLIVPTQVHQLQTVYQGVIEVSLAKQYVFRCFSVSWGKPRKCFRYSVKGHLIGTKPVSITPINPADI